MTRSAGTSGLTLAGSPPRSAIASRMTARSTTAGNAGEVLEQDAGGHERDLRLGGGARPPGQQRLDVGRLDDAAAGVPEQVLEQDLDRDRQRGEVDPVGDGVEPVDVGEAGPERRAGAERIDGSRGRHDAPPSSTAQCAGYSRRRVGAPTPVEVRASIRRRVAPSGRTARYTRWMLPGDRTMTPSSMRAWGDLPGDDPTRQADERAEKEAAIEAAGIDLDPAAARLAPPRRRRPTRPTTPTRTSIPAPGEPPIIGIVGAGAVGTALGVALTRAGWPIHAVASRDAGRRERFRSLVDVRPRLRRPGADPRGGRADHPGRPGRRRRAAGRLAPDVQRPGDDPHQRRARRGGPRTGDGGRDADRRLPSARRLRRHGTGGRRAPRRHGRHRGRRPAGGDAGRHGRGDRRDAGPPGARVPRPPTTPRRSWPPVGSSPCSTRSPSSGGWPASTRPVRWRSTARSSRGRSATPGRSGSAAALTGPMTRGDVGTLEAHLATLRRPRPRRARSVRRRGRAARSIWPRRVARWHRRRREDARTARCGLASPA